MFSRSSFRLLPVFILMIFLVAQVAFAADGRMRHIGPDRTTDPSEPILGTDRDREQAGPAVTSEIESLMVTSCTNPVAGTAWVELTARAATNGIPPYMYRWTSDLVGDLVVVPGTVWSGELPFGTHGLVLTVTDSTPPAEGGPYQTTSGPEHIEISEPLNTGTHVFPLTRCPDPESGLNEAHLMADAIGGTPPYDFLWHRDDGWPDESGQEIVLFLPPGVHTLTMEVTDSTEAYRGGPCTASANVEVRMPLPVFSIITDVSVQSCTEPHTGTADVLLQALEGSGGWPEYTYRWSSDITGDLPPSPDPMFSSNLPAGIHELSLVVTDSTPIIQGGPCQWAAGSMTLEVAPPLSVQIGGIKMVASPPDGGGGLFELQADVSGSYGPFVYEWASYSRGVFLTTDDPVGYASFPAGNHTIYLTVTDYYAPFNSGPCINESFPVQLVVD